MNFQATRHVSSRPTCAYISLGSNQGDARANLCKALHAIENLDGIACTQTSSVYLTEPQGVRDQPWFANQVAQLQCDPFVTSSGLLRALLGIETAQGRVRIHRWGPRIIDLDLLVFGNLTTNDPELILPHPRLKQRAFVLIPLLEIEPDLILPDGTRPAHALDMISYTVDKNIIRQADSGN
jgi:2-amino-4-hydroxy-6-hydroxymethyldihydropteridine diphosphokinase